MKVKFTNLATSPVSVILSVFVKDLASRAIKAGCFAALNMTVLLLLSRSVLAAGLADSSISIVQNETWQPIENKKIIEPGSVLDFSFLVDSPAGKHGKLIVNNSRFEFETQPGRQVKFFGANLCYDLCYPSKADAPKVAETLQRLGYNLIRFEHYDVTLMPETRKDLDPDRLDKIEYLIHCLKQRGIYVMIDLHSGRTFPAEDAPELGRPFGREIANLIHVSPTARKAWERFARALLTHRNPYTKLTWAEDPVLVGICPVNEDFIYGPPTPPDSLFGKAFTRWLAEKKITVQTEDQKRAAYNQFQTELQRNTYVYYKNFLNSLGVKALMTGANNVEIRVLALLRQRVDFVDSHCYWNHPDFIDGNFWRLPWKQVINVSDLPRSSGMHRIYGPVRILGKPFTVTEFNYCYPSLSRSEGGPLMGAYAAFQNWDTLLRFDFGHDADVLSHERPAYVFGAVYDPINRLTQNIIALLFLRGDVSPAKKSIPYLITENTMYRTFTKLEWDYFPDSFRLLSLCTGVGSLDATDPSRVEGKFPIAVVPAACTEKFSKTKLYTDDESLVRRLIADKVIEGFRCREKEGRYISDTGQLDLNSVKGTFKAVTPRSEAFILMDKGRLAGGRVTVENDGGMCTVFAAAVDDQPLEKSKRLLVLHLTDVQNNKTRFSKDMTIWESVGELPHLVRRGSAQVSIRFDAERKVHVWAVDLSGARKKEIKLTQSGPTISFAVNTIQPDGTFLAYEIEIQ
jgi:hypothetical protein